MLELSCCRMKLLSFLALLWFFLAGITVWGSQTKAYVPKDLYDCYLDLERNLEPEVVSKMKSASTVEEAIRNFPQVGAMIKERWELDKKSRIAGYFKKFGIRNPDDMTLIILKGFWHHLNETPYNLNQHFCSKMSGKR